MRKKNEGGFTIIEMLVVVGIILILAGFVTSGSQRAREFANARSSQAEIYAFAVALRAFSVDNGTFPVGNNAAAVAALTANVGNGPYIEIKAEDIVGGAFVDPWGNAYIYTMPGVNNVGSFDIRGAGIDQAMNTADDITNW